ncbi:MAG: DUF2256 domain-containing protein [Acidobacteriota bacterium]|nr:DUF2256 domain-containing protein [Blastocatellia bacterium]MDW8240817.1 DUF2256 domain-containing protein [Acidobacteriota bacterium]
MKTRPRKKHSLPTKVCVVCGRSFAWRRKWAHEWHRVRYCSRRCRARSSGVAKNPSLMMKHVDCR